MARRTKPGSACRTAQPRTYTLTQNRALNETGAFLPRTRPHSTHDSAHGYGSYTRCACPATVQCYMRFPNGRMQMRWLRIPVGRGSPIEWWPCLALAPRNGPASLSMAEVAVSTPTLFPFAKVSCNESA